MAQHEWETPDLSTCSKCGDKDWMADKECNESNCCIYPDCNCPFDIGPDNKCLRGLPRKSKQCTKGKDMTRPTMEEIEKRLARSQAQTKQLLEEVEIKNRVIQLLVVAGHLDKDRLEQATELAGGI